MLQRKKDLPSSPSELQPLVHCEIERFSSYLEGRFGSGAALVGPERAVLETYIVWKARHDEEANVRTEDQV